MSLRSLCFLPINGWLVSCAAPDAVPTPTPLPVSTQPATPETPALTDIPVPRPLSFPDAFAAARALGCGVNMGDALDATPNEGARGVTLQEGYFEQIKQAGFNSVRLPVRWSAHALDDAPYTLDAKFLARVDQVIGWALARDLLVVLDIHHYEEMASNPRDHEQRFLALWEQIAEHYKDYPQTLFFEPLNEPNSALDASLWNQFAGEALATIRKSNPQRMVVIGGPLWNSYDNLQSLELPDADWNIIVTYHYYNPFQFTHQGAEWVEGSNPWLGTTWTGNVLEKTEVTFQFDRVADWAREHNRPVYMGEFGAYSKANMASRARWTAFVAREAEARGFAWAYWEFCAGFGVYDPIANTWREPLLRALIP